MVKFKGAGTTTRAPSGGGAQRASKGAQRASDSLVQSMDRTAGQAASMGRTVQGAVENVQQQDKVAADQQARKDRLDVEMAKGGLQFQGKGPEKRVIPTEAAGKKAKLEERKVDIAAQRAENEERRAAAYEMSQQLSLIKAGYSENGELSDEGRNAIKNLSRDYKKQQRLFQALNQGDPAAIRQAQAMMPQPPEAGETGEGGSTFGIDRVMSGVRAALDHSQMKFIATSKGERPDDAMDDSMAWQSFYGWKNEIASMMKSGQMPVPNFQSLQQRNRYLNELAAKQVLKGRAAPGSMADPSLAPGSMADPSLTQGLVPAQAAAGQPDDGSQQPQQPQPSHSGPGAIANTGSSQAGPDWAGIK